MTLRALPTLVLMLLAATAWAQSTKPTATAAIPADPVVARVNGFELRRSDVQEVARNLPPQVRQQSPDKLYAALLDQMVATTLVAQAARKAKTQDDPDAKRRLALAQDQVLAQVYIDHLVRKGITEQKLKTRYDKFIKEAPPREEVNARHILLASEAEAKGVIEQVKKGADFAALAKDKSTDPAGKTSGGDLGWFTKDQMVPAFAEAAFKLKKGEVTDAPVHTQFGWHVIKLEDRRIAAQPTFDQIKPQIADEIAREMVAEKMKELKVAAKIEVFNADGSKPGAAPAPQPAAPAPATVPDPSAPTLSPATMPKE